MIRTFNNADWILNGHFYATEDFSFSSTTLASLDSSVFGALAEGAVISQNGTSWISPLGTPAAYKGIYVASGDVFIIGDRYNLSTLRGLAAAGTVFWHVEYWK